MHGLSWSRRRAAGLIGGVVLAGSVLATGVAAAQTPPAASTEAAEQVQPAQACRLDPMSSAEIARMRSEFAAKLARALGMSATDVERALEQVEGQRPPLAADQVMTFEARPIDASHLAPAAARLGVTSEELANALHAAAPEAVECAVASAAGGAGIVLRAELPVEHFEAVARQLGRGITGAQVQEAMESLLPPGGVEPGTGVIRLQPDEHVQALARALGVSAERLIAALESIAPPFPAVPAGPRG